MPSSILSSMPGGMPRPQSVPMNIDQNFMSQLNEFAQMLSGNPQQIAMSLMNSGKMSQAQFQQYAAIADQITGGRR